MHLDPVSTIAGLPGTIVRELLRRARAFDFNRHYAAARLRTSARRATSVLKDLTALGYLERVDRGSETFFRVTSAGSTLGLASAAKPLRRVTAERKLADFLERVRRVNADDSYLYRVRKVMVFGSYLTSALRLSDIDVAVELVSRVENAEERRVQHMARIREAIRNGRRFSNISQEVTWPYTEVLLALKARSRAISLHTTNDEILKSAECRVVFEDSVPTQ